MVTLIGATTENPYFEVNSALISRCQLYRFEPLAPELVERVVTAALQDEERGLGGKGVTLGDGRPRATSPASRAATRASRSTRSRRPGAPAPPRRRERRSPSRVDDLQDAAQKSPVMYDRDDAHYDTISAFIKSMRGSDPDAAVYYLASMIAGGEDPKFIARRMIVFASEDVGNADPQALQVAVAAARAVEFVGLPECRINLSQAATYLALAPKSNAAYKAVDAALDDVRREGNQPPPLASAQRELPRREGTRPRRGVQVPARERRLGRAAVPAGRALRAPLLRADTRGREPGWPPAWRRSGGGRPARAKAMRSGAGRERRVRVGPRVSRGRARRARSSSGSSRAG